MDETVRVGVIGCGAGLGHVRHYAALPGVDLVALAGLDRDRCQRITQEYRIPRLYADYSELLAQPDIDAVSVCVPNYLHAPVTITALEAGKHVLVEKPLATTVAEGEAMAAAAARTGRVLMVVFNYRLREDSQCLRHYIEGGYLGEVYFVRAGWLRQHGIPGIGSWFTNRSLSGGGCVIDLGVHMLDLALWLMGNPRVLTASAATCDAMGSQGRGMFPGSRFRQGSEAFDVEDFALAFLRLEGGITLLLEVSWAGYTHWGDDFFIHLWGSQGGAEMNVKEYAQQDTLRFFADLQGTRTESRPQIRGESGKSVVSEFVRAVRRGEAVSPTAEEGLRALRIIEAIYRSAAEGHEVKV